MDKLKELLIALFGQDVVDKLTEDQIKQVNTTMEELLPEAQVIKALQEGYKAEDGTIVLDKVTDPEVKALIEELQGKVTEATENANTANTAAETASTEAKTAKDELTGFKRSTAMESALTTANVVDVKDFLTIYADQLKDLVVTDKGVDGLDGVIEKAKTEKPYLFKQADKGGNGGNGSLNPPGKTPAKSYTKGMSFADAWQE
jgi:hypothetical protein